MSMDLSDVEQIHRYLGELLSDRSVVESTHRRFLTQVECIISDYLVKNWCESKNK